MKLVLDERVKHRMIGLAVIVSLAAIFAPAIMKKSNQRFDKDVGMRIQLPPKPTAPQVALADKDKLFKTIKIAHVKLPAEDSHIEPTQLAQIENKIPLEAIAKNMDKNFVASIPQLEKIKKESPQASNHRVKVQPAKPQLALSQTKKVVTVAAVKKPLVLALNQEIYSVQLASFARRENAQVLVNRLRSKGYVGKIVRISGRSGNQFKVFVGKSYKKENALKLKNQLAVALQLHGFVVSGVG